MLRLSLQLGVSKFPDRRPGIPFPQLLRQRIHFAGSLLHLLPLFFVLAPTPFGFDISLQSGLDEGAAMGPFFLGFFVDLIKEFVLQENRHAGHDTHPKAKIHYVNEHSKPEAAICIWSLTDRPAGL